MMYLLRKRRKNSTLPELSFHFGVILFLRTASWFRLGCSYFLYELTLGVFCGIMEILKNTIMDDESVVPTPVVEGEEN